MQLKAAERLAIIDAPTASLDQPDPEIERIWGEEALPCKKMGATPLGALAGGRGGE